MKDKDSQHRTERHAGSFSQCLLPWHGKITLTGGTDRAEQDGRRSLESSVAKVACVYPVSQCLEKAWLTGEMKEGRCQLHLFQGLLKERRLLSAAQ